MVQQDLQLLVVGGLAASGGGRSRLSPNILQQPETLAVVSSVLVPIGSGFSGVPRSVYLDSQSGSGSKRAKRTQKGRKQLINFIL